MNNPLINPGLGTFFWMLVSFGILVFILGKWGWPMLLKSLKKREEAIAESLNAAEKARIDATEEANRIVENARKNIEFEKLKAMHELKNQIAVLSIEIAEKLMKAELSDKQKADDLVRKELENANLN